MFVKSRDIGDSTYIRGGGLCPFLDLTLARRYPIPDMVGGTLGILPKDGPLEAQTMATRLRSDEDQFTGLAWPNPVGLLHIDARGNCISANTQWFEFAGCSPEDPRGRGWLNVFPSGERARMEELWNVPPSGEFSRDISLLLPTGSDRRVRCNGLPIFNGDQDSLGFILAFCDLSVGHPSESAHEETARALRKRVRELHCLFEIPRLVERTGGMSIRDIAEGTVKILPSSLRFPEIAFARLTLEGEQFVFPPEGADPVWMERAEIKVHGEPAGVVELGYFELPPSEGEPPFLEEETTLLSSIAQRLGRMVERIKDAERLREKEAELSATMAHMTRVAIVGEMAANIAHELNQPLTAITSFAEASRRILNGRKTDFGKLSQALTWIADEALRAGEVIRQLSDLVKRRETRHEVLDLNDTIGSMEHLVSVFARRHHVQLAIELDPDLPPVCGDRVQIQQVLLNLVRNGVDAVCEKNSPEGRVVVRTETSRSGEVQISVEDNGPGLALGMEEEVFRSFSTTKETGMGLGLSISKSIVAAHGGRIGYVPRPGGGTVFFFTIPGHDQT